MATFTKYLAAGSAAADKYSLTLQVDATHVAAANKDDVRVRGTIKSHNSSYTSYRSSSSNTVKVTDEDGTVRLSKSPTTAYDCRNQGSTQIFDYTFEVPHGSDGKRTLNFSWTFDGLQNSWNPTGTVTGTLELTRTSFKVTFDDNGGDGGPDAQTKYYGSALTLSSTKPTRTGYDFLGWGTSASDTTVDYAAGASYTANAAITLYAIWQLKTYAVSFNANGGSGVPSAQIKTYGETLTLSKTIPVLKNHKFIGWSTSKTATEADVEYYPGDSYTTNASLTLYAVWKEEGMLFLAEEDKSISKGRPTLITEGTAVQGIPYIYQDGIWKRGGGS